PCSWFRARRESRPWRTRRAQRSARRSPPPSVPSERMPLTVARSGAVHEYEYASGVGVHVLIDAAGARNARPARPDPPAGLHELALEDEDELGALVSVQGKPRPGLEADDLHLPAVGHRDVLHEHARREARRPPPEVSRVHAEHFARLEHCRAG